jgi:hypothetical protein
MRRTLQLLTAIAFATTIGLAAVQTAAAQSDVIIYTHPERPKNRAERKTLRAVLIGYDSNRGDYTVSPYIVVRELDDRQLVRIFLSPDTKIDGVRFFCPLNPGMTTGPGICPQLPSSLALKVPILVDVVVWRDGLLFEKEPILGTDTITVVGRSTLQP